jgi:hypothetical protein
MFKILKQLVALKRTKCKHEYGEWESNRTLELWLGKKAQRQCKKCGKWQYR